MRNLVIFLSLIITLSTSTIWPNPSEQEEKVYIAPSELMLLDQGMYAYIEGEWTQIDALYRDPQGYFVDTKKNPNVNQWWCPSCNYCNSSWSRTCQREYADGEKCGYPRPW